MTRRRVVVTGVGLVTPLGAGVELNWERMLRGESGVGPITRFDVSTMDVRIAAEVRPLPAVPEDASAPHLGIHSRFALVAGREAWVDAGLADARIDRARAGVFLGSGKGISELEWLVEAVCASRKGNEPTHYPAFLRAGLTSFLAARRVEEDYAMSAGRLAAAVGATGPHWVCITACAAGNHAIGEAYEAILHGEAEILLAGGTHSQIDLMSLSGYSMLGALSPSNDEPHKASRPFDRRRNGFILGEGAGIMVLEEYEHARRRGAHIRAEVCGYGNTADSHRVTDPRPDGLGAENAMRIALEDAAVAPDAIGYINAHGTSTTQNDKMESEAIKRIFGPKGEAPPVSSTKSMIGHLIAAAGAVEAIVCVRALETQTLPPTINYENPDPECDLDYLPGEPREAQVEYAMNNSFGFGGQNIVTVFQRFSG